MRYAAVLIGMWLAAANGVATAQAASEFDAYEFASRLAQTKSSGFFVSAERLEEELTADNRCPSKPRLGPQRQACATLLYVSERREEGQKPQIFFRPVFGYKKNKDDPAKSRALVLWDGKMEEIASIRLFGATTFEGAAAERNFIPYAVIGNRENQALLSEGHSPLSAAGHARLFVWTDRLSSKSIDQVYDWQF